MTTPRPNGWLLDTNVVLHLARHNRTGRVLAANFGLNTKTHLRFVCEVSLGETESFALCNNWGRRRRQGLESTLADFEHPLDISPPAHFFPVSRSTAFASTLSW